MQFLAMKANGLSEPQIAAECFVIRQTVNKTLTEARERLEATTTLQAVVRAIAMEILVLDADGNVSVPESYNYLYDPAGALPRRLAA